jgi:hypothetical protein
MASTTITTIELDDGSLLRMETAAPSPVTAEAADSAADAYEPIGRPRPAEAVGNAGERLVCTCAASCAPPVAGPTARPSVPSRG